MEINQIKKKNYTEIDLRNSAGLNLKLSTLGAGIREVKVPDRCGKQVTVTLCPVKEDEYLGCYHGKTIGRTSGRISGATFTVNNKTAVLERNNYGEDNLHGGACGFHAADFAFEVKRDSEYTDIVFTHFSPDGEGGYFGNVKIIVTYRVMEKVNEFRILFDCTSDEPTLLNLTNHVYWNLGGNLNERVSEEELYINAPVYGKLNERLIVENIVPVNEEMDFRKAHNIGDFLENENVQRYTKGYDHPFFLAPHSKDCTVAYLYSGLSGVKLDVSTTYPCIVLYTDGQADSRVEVYKGKYDEKYLGACLECQYHPDGIHQSPDNCGILTSDKPYHEEIGYKFSLK